MQQELLGQSVSLAQAQQLQDLVFLRRDAQPLIADQRGPAVEVHEQLAGAHCGGGVAFCAPDDGVDARDQLASLKGLGQEIVGAEAEPLDLVVDLAEAGEDQHRRVDPGRPQFPQHLVSGHVWQHQIKDYEIRSIVARLLQSARTIGGGRNSVARLAQIQREQVGNVHLVFDDENFPARASLHEGSNQLALAVNFNLSTPQSRAHLAR